MTGVDLKDLARRGAVARLAELHAEEAAIGKTFPELTRAAGVAYTDDGTTISSLRKHRKRKRMSRAQRRAVEVRMKAYWAKRRKAKSA